MQTRTFSFVFGVLFLYSANGRRYHSYRRYGRHHVKHRPVKPEGSLLPINPPVNICPQLVCPLIDIPNECRKEIYTNVYGVLCRGCDKNICENNKIVPDISKIQPDNGPIRGDIPKVPKFLNQMTNKLTGSWLDANLNPKPVFIPNNQFQSNNNIQLQNNVPVWQNNLPVNTQWKNNGPLDTQWQNNVPANIQWQDNVPINSHWQNSVPMNNQWQNNGAGNSLWQNNGAGNSLWQNNGADNSLWQNTGAVNTQWQNTLPNSQSQNTLPINQNNNMQFPVNNQWQSAPVFRQQPNTLTVLGTVVQGLPSSNTPLVRGSFPAPNQLQAVPQFNQNPSGSSLPVFRNNQQIGTPISGLPIQLTGKAVNSVPIRKESDQNGKTVESAPVLIKTSENLGFTNPLYDELPFVKTIDSLNSKVYEANTPKALSTKAVNSVGGM
ncbi:unnamed protein product [Mytilus coruscus]|uniref:Uncharacterized protein n=1 Tax=Mytilus coruscus TaxID=42192 RepID=A0A6J8BY94_MYTCO|nr:unnamed protein product [Mytilus coruscus]